MILHVCTPIMLTRKYHLSNIEHPALPTPNTSRKAYMARSQNSQLPHAPVNSSSQSRVRRNVGVTASFRSRKTGDISSSDDESSASLSLSPSPPAVSPLSPRSSIRMSSLGKMSSASERDTHSMRDTRKTSEELKKSRECQDLKISRRDTRDSKDMPKPKEVFKSKWDSGGFPSERESSISSSGRIYAKSKAVDSEPRAVKDVWELKLPQKSIASNIEVDFGDVNINRESRSRKFVGAEAKDSKETQEVKDFYQESKDAKNAKVSSYSRDKKDSRNSSQAREQKESKSRGDVRQIWDGNEKVHDGKRDTHGPQEFQLNLKSWDRSATKGKSEASDRRESRSSNSTTEKTASTLVLHKSHPLTCVSVSPPLKINVLCVILLVFFPYRRAWVVIMHACILVASEIPSTHQNKCSSCVLTNKARTYHQHIFTFVMCLEICMSSML